MFEKPTANYAIGLIYNFDHIIGAELTVKQKKVQLVHIFNIPSTKKNFAEITSAPLAQAEEKRVKKFDSANGNDFGNIDFVHAMQDGVTATAIDSDRVLLRNVEVKLTKDSDIDDVLMFQVEPMLPFSAEEAVIDRMIVEKGADRTFLTAFTVNKKHLEEHLNQWHSLGIDPEVISNVPAALGTFSNYFYESDTPLFIIHLGENNLTGVVVQKGLVIVSQSAEIGFKDVLTAYEESFHKEQKEALIDLEEIDFSKDNIDTTPQLNTVIQRLQQEFLRLILALNKQARDKEAKQVLICGYVSHLKNIFSDEINQLKLTQVKPVIKDDFGITETQAQEAAVPLGLALSCLDLGEQQINFRQKEYVYPNPWKRLGKTVITYFCLCAALGISAYLLGQTYLGSQEDELKNNYSLMLKTLNKDYDQVERDFEKQYGSNFENNGNQLMPLAKLTPDEIGKRLEFISNQILKAPKTIPLMPHIPRVSDVLAWLNAHPNVTAKDPETGKLIPLLQLEGFHYALVKRPDPAKPREHYQVQIELEFSSKSPKWARQFHDALIAPNDFVDDTQEIKWNAGKDRYRASFFLKDRTRYP